MQTTIYLPRMAPQESPHRQKKYFSKNHLNGVTNSMRSIYFLIFCGLLSACATPPEQRSTPKTASELAATQLPGTAQQVREMPMIASLPQPESAPPSPDINNAGSLPPIASHTAKPKPLPANVQKGPVSLDFEQVPLREVLQMVADTLGLTVLIDPAIGDKVTIRTAPGKPLSFDDLWPLLQLLLKENDIAMEQRGNVYHLKKQPGSSLPLEIGQASSRLTQSNAPEVLQITPLRYITVESALTTLKPMIEPEGKIISLPTLNLLGIITTPPKLQRINGLLNLVDADPFVHRGIRLFRLLNVKAADAKTDLDKILQAIEGKTPSYEIIDLERINGLLVVAPPKRGFNEIERWIAIVDEENEAGGEQVFIYRVRNLKASELAATLMDVFQTDDEKELRTRKSEQEKAKEKNKTPEKETTAQPDLTKPAATSANSAMPTTVSAELTVNIVADEATNSLLVRATPKDYRQLLGTIALLDTVPKEVMINVVIAEVALTDQNRFGIDWSRLFGTTNRTYIGNNLAVPSSGIVDASGNISIGDNGLVLGYVGDKVSAVLNTLSSNGNVELLSRPSLLVRNNQEASISVGSDEPTITRINQTNTSTVNNLTTSNEVQYRKTGIILKVKPQINEDGVINLEIRQEVSSLGTGDRIENLPSFSERVVETSLVAKDGNAIVMGGLIQTEWKNDFQGVPGLQDIPLAGRLFQSEEIKKTRTELVIIIVPQIIHPEADNSSYVRLFRDRMKHVKRLMENDDSPVVFSQDKLYLQPPAKAQIQPGEQQP